MIVLFDQLTAWSCGLLSLWVIHLVGGIRQIRSTRRDTIGIALMVVSLAAFAFVQIVLAMDRIAHELVPFITDFRLVGGILRSPIIGLLIGVIIFHRKRFCKV